MSEQFPGEDPVGGRTGVARVDAVIETLDHLDELPLEEHVQAFEVAHDELRRALDASPTSPTRDAMARVAAGSTAPVAGG